MIGYGFDEENTEFYYTFSNSLFEPFLKIPRIKVKKAYADKAEASRIRIRADERYYTIYIFDRYLILEGEEHSEEKIYDNNPEGTELLIKFLHTLKETYTLRITYFFSGSWSEGLLFAFFETLAEEHKKLKQRISKKPI